MGKARIFEVAKQYGVDSKILLTQAKDLGFDVKNHMSMINDIELRVLKEKLKLRSQDAAETAPPEPQDPVTPPDLQLDAVKVVSENRQGLRVEEQRIRSTVIRRRKFAASPSADDHQEHDSGSETPETEPEHTLLPPLREEHNEAFPDGPAAVVTAPEQNTVEEVLHEQPVAPIHSEQSVESEQTVQSQSAQSTQSSQSGPAQVAPGKDEDRGRNVLIKNKQGTTSAYRFEHLKVVETEADRNPPGQPVAPAETATSATDNAETRRKAKEAVVDPKDPASYKKLGAKEDLKSAVKRKPQGGKRNVVIERSLGDDRDTGTPERAGDHGAMRRKKQRKVFHKTEITLPKAAKRVIKIHDTIQVAELSHRLGVKAGEIIGRLMKMGMMATINQTIDHDTATLIATEYQYEVENIAVNDTALIQEHSKKTGGEAKDRAPVVTIMGHVDHGKTSILDAIRKARVAEGEAGGITQHIGAYAVPVGEKTVTFIDTPGHAAFTEMRARGARVTDLVVLVVASDDGVMPQTIEAIKHAQAAKVPILVAINKMDLPQANPEKVKQQLTEYGLVSEEWGGDTMFVGVSAKAKMGIDTLLESILLQAEVLELRASMEGAAEGVVIESKLDKNRGPIMTVIVQQGVLSVGDFIVCGGHYGRIKSLQNDLGKRIDKAFPSQPVEILGLPAVEAIGESFHVVKDDKTAKTIVESRQDKARVKDAGDGQAVSLDGLFQQIKDKQQKVLNIIVKSDTQGTAEALRQSFLNLSTEEVGVNVILHGAGAISGSDVNMAASFGAQIVAFNVKPDARAAAVIEQTKAIVGYFSTIYEAIDTVARAAQGLVEPVFEERSVGKAEIRNVFVIPKQGTVAGSYVLSGKIQRNTKVRIIRGEVTVFDGKLRSLRRFKEDVKEVATGYECGIAVEGFNDVQVGDILECYTLEEVAPLARTAAN